MIATPQPIKKLQVQFTELWGVLPLDNLKVLPMRKLFCWRPNMNKDFGSKEKGCVI